MPPSQPMPTLFVPHGAGPCFFMDWDPVHAWDKMAVFLRGIRSGLLNQPKAILMVSAHWCEAGFQVTSGERPALIFDYYGFPEHTYRLQYPAPGAPALAQRIIEQLGQAGLSCTSNPSRGFDHGMFIPLMLMFPEADIPVVQLSLDRGLDPALHLRAGQALAGLRHEEVLIIGSGMSFHNMRGYGNPAFSPISDSFDAWLTQAIEADPVQRGLLLSDWAQAPQARLCHPLQAEEHLIPLMLVAGAAFDAPGQRVFSDRVLETTLSAFQFG